MRLLTNTPIIVKALFIAAMPLAMLTLWMVSDLHQAYKDEASMQTMLQAADITGMTSALIDKLQKERNMSAGSLGRDKDFLLSKLVIEHQKVNKGVAELARLLDQNTGFIHLVPSLGETLKHFMQEITVLNSVRQRIQQQTIKVDDLLAYYTGLIDDLIQTSNNIRMIYTFTTGSAHSQPSNTTVAPNARFSGLMSSFIQLGRAEEATSVEHALLSNAFSTGHLSPDMYEHLINQISLQKHLLYDFSLQSPDNIHEILSSHDTSETTTDIERFRTIAINKKNDGDFGVDPEQWFQSSSKRIALLHQIEAKVVELIRQESQLGLEEAGHHLNITISKGLATLLITGGFASWVTWLLLLGIRHAKNEAKKEHELIECLLAAMPSILIAVDSKGIISLWNDVAETVFALSRKTVTGTPFSSLSIAWDWNEINRALVESEALFTSSLNHVKFKRDDGDDGFLELTINAVMEDGQHNGFLLIGADKTERLRLENQLQMSQKMESMGELAAGIAHEINTPMQYIGDNVRFLKDGFSDILQLISSYHQTIDEINRGKLSSEHEVAEIIQQAEEGADIEFLREEVPLAVEQTLEGIAHVSKIVGAMKELSHPGTGDKSPIDLNKVIENTVTVSRNEWKYVADLEMNLDPELPMIHCLPEINQVFLNIIINAAHAIEEQLHNSSEEQGKIQIQSSFSNESVEIRISDSGAGIAKGKAGKIFDPFFTTKAPGKGTGQGLAISHQIVCNRLGGQLSVESEPGHGSCFIIKLPIAEEL